MCDLSMGEGDPVGFQNPYRCTASSQASNSGSYDCYKLRMGLHVAKTERPNAKYRVWQTDMTIRIKNPKTATATIDDVKISTPVAGPSINGSIDRWFEPMWAGDGRMVVGRVERATLPNAPSDFANNVYNNVYSVYSGGKICDYNKMNEHVRPIAFGHYDKKLDKNKYPWAKYPMKSTKGEEYNKFSDNGGFSYPWSG